MIIPRHEEIAHLVARNVTYSGAGNSCHGGNCIILQAMMGFILALPAIIFFLFVTAVTNVIIWLTEPRNLISFLAWAVTFVGVAINLQRRGIRMTEDEAEEVGAFLRSRGFGRYVPRRPRQWFSNRRKLSPVVGILAIITATAVASIVWASIKGIEMLREDARAR